MPGVLQVLFPDWAHSFTSCQLAIFVKEEYWVLVKGYELSLPRKRLGSTSHSDITSAV